MSSTVFDLDYEETLCDFIWRNRENKNEYVIDMFVDFEDLCNTFGYDEDYINSLTESDVDDIINEHVSNSVMVAIEDAHNITLPSNNVEVVEVKRGYYGSRYQVNFS